MLLVIERLELGESHPPGLAVEGAVSLESVGSTNPHAQHVVEVVGGVQTLPPEDHEAFEALGPLSYGGEIVGVAGSVDRVDVRQSSGLGGHKTGSWQTLADKGIGHPVA